MEPRSHVGMHLVPARTAAPMGPPLWGAGMSCPGHCPTWAAEQRQPRGWEGKGRSDAAMCFYANILLKAASEVGIKTASSHPFVLVVSFARTAVGSLQSHKRQLAKARPDPGLGMGCYTGLPLLIFWPIVFSHAGCKHSRHKV